MENSSQLIQWQVEPISPSKKLFLIFNFLLFFLLIYFFYLKEYFLVLLIALIIFAWFVIYFHPNQRIDVSLDQEKITLNQDAFYFSDFDSFAIFKDSKENLYLKFYPKSRFKFSREILLPKDKVKITQIKNLLEKILKEKENASESIIDEILRNIGL